MSIIFTYQTKNKVNGKTYIGVRKTNNIGDGYIGSGIKSQNDAERVNRKRNSAFGAAVCKYGYDNFIREELAFFDNYEDALEEEAYLVDEEWVLSDNNYNIALGGVSPVLVGDAEKKRLESCISAIKESNSRKWVVIHRGEDPKLISNLSEYSRSCGLTRDNFRTEYFDNGVWACRVNDYINGKRPRERKQNKTSKWIVKEKCGVTHKVNNLSKFAKDHGLNKSSLYHSYYNSRWYKGYKAISSKDIDEEDAES